MDNDASALLLLSLLLLCAFLWTLVSLISYPITSYLQLLLLHLHLNLFIFLFKRSHIVATYHERYIHS